MMNQDKFLMMSDEQAITTTADSVVLDLQKPGDFMKPLYWILRVAETFETSDSAVLSATLQTADDSGSYAAVPGMALGATTVADLTAGTVLLRQPIPACDVKRYLKTVYSVSVGSFSAGKIDSYISENQGGIY